MHRLLFFFLLLWSTQLLTAQSVSPQPSQPVDIGLYNNEVAAKSRQIDSLFQQGNFAEALTALEQTRLFIEQAQQQADTNYCSVLIGMARCNYRLRNIEQAIDYTRQALEVEKKYRGDKTADYALWLDNLGHYHASLKQNAEAYECARQALSVYEQQLTNDIHMGIILMHLAEACYALERHADAVKYQVRALAIYKKERGEHSDEYIQEVRYLAMYYRALGNMKKAEENEQRADQLEKEAREKGDVDYGEAFATAEKCRRYNEDILNICKSFLILDFEDEDIDVVNRILVTWSINSADVNIGIGRFAVALIDGKDEPNVYFVAYLAACIQDQLVNGKRDNDKKLSLPAVKALVEFYDKAQSQYGDRQILDVLLSALRNNKLEETINTFNDDATPANP